METHPLHMLRVYHWLVLAKIGIVSFCGDFEEISWKCFYKSLSRFQRILSRCVSYADAQS